MSGNDRKESLMLRSTFLSLLGSSLYRCFVPEDLHAQSAAGSTATVAIASDDGPMFRELDLFVAGREGYFRYRIPGLTVTTKGTILAFAEARNGVGEDWDPIDIVVKRSLDNGKTWSGLELVVGNGVDTTNQPTPVVDRDTGVVWLPFCKKNRELFVTKSGDDGVTWSRPIDITRQVMPADWHYFGAGPGHGIQLASGRLLIPAWGDAASSPEEFGRVQFSFTFYSDDHGATWKRGEPLDMNASDECEVVETADGRVYMNMRSHLGRRRSYAWSEDGGVTWSKVKVDERLPDVGCQGSVIRYTDQARFGKNRILLCNPASSTDRSKLTVRMSYDEAETWPVAKMIREEVTGYSDLGVAPDMTILCLYEVRGPLSEELSKMVLARFNLAWLTNCKDSL